MSWDSALGLYNYWIVIFLMMTGFYIVIARENFIKTIIGLNIFQTSVILLYVTMGRIDGGTAPIIPPEIAARFSQTHASHDHSETDHLPHAQYDSETPKGDSPTDNGAAETPGDSAHHHADGAANNLKDRPPQATAADLLPEDVDAPHSQAYAGAQADGSELTTDEIIFSNPIPSVLMLTAIVVGIATTALALALIVRIREDYGTIEENEVLELDRLS